MPTNKYIRMFLESITRARTINLRKELRGQKLPLYYKITKSVGRPIVFTVGWLINKNIISKSEITVNDNKILFTKKRN